jgi:hypothetical protein
MMRTGGLKLVERLIALTMPCKQNLLQQDGSDGMADQSGQEGVIRNAAVGRVCENLLVGA